jgi:hypothetical protein
MVNINRGGAKVWSKFPQTIQQAWRVMDITPLCDVPYDLNSGKSIPLCNGVVDNYYTSHTLEHVHPVHVSHVFAELKRTLVSGGKLRIVVPDFRKACTWYINGDNMLFHAAGPSQCQWTIPTPLGRLMTWVHSPDRKHSSGHHSAYDEYTLRHLLSTVGFTNIKTMTHNHCSKVFVGLDILRYLPFSLYMEAVG